MLLIDNWIMLQSTPPTTCIFISTTFVCSHSWKLALVSFWMHNLWFRCFHWQKECIFNNIFGAVLLLFPTSEFHSKSKTFIHNEMTFWCVQSCKTMTFCFVMAKSVVVWFLVIAFSPPFQLSLFQTSWMNACSSFSTTPNVMHVHNKWFFVCAESCKQFHWMASDEICCCLIFGIHIFTTALVWCGPNEWVEHLKQLSNCSTNDTRSQKKNVLVCAVMRTISLNFFWWDLLLSDFQCPCFFTTVSVCCDPNEGVEHLKQLPNCSTSDVHPQPIDILMCVVMHSILFDWIEWNQWFSHFWCLFFHHCFSVMWSKKVSWKLEAAFQLLHNWCAFTAMKVLVCAVMQKFLSTIFDEICCCLSFSVNCFTTVSVGCDPNEWVERLKQLPKNLTSKWHTFTAKEHFGVCSHANNSIQLFLAKTFCCLIFGIFTNQSSVLWSQLVEWTLESASEPILKLSTFMTKV